MREETLTTSNWRSSLRLLALAFVCLCVLAPLIMGILRPSNLRAFMEHRPATVAQPVALSVTPEYARDSSSHEIKRLCFYRSNYVYLQDTTTLETRQVAKGEYPELSPDGNSIAYTDGMPERDHVATIKIMNLNTNEVKGFAALAGFHSYGSRWSHDGKKLAFNVISADGVPKVGLLNLETDQFEVLSRNVGSADHLVFDSWLRDDKSVICHDLRNIYEIGMDGRLLQETSIESIVPRGNISTATRFSFSSNRRYLLFDGHRDPENQALYVFDLKNHKLSSITPPTIDAIEPTWLPSEKAVVFSRFKENPQGHPLWDICTVEFEGTKITVLIENGSKASTLMK